MRYASVVVLLSLSSVVVGCSDSQRKRPIGSTCESSSECADGLCLAGRCLDPEADEDGDGLVNRVEGSLGTDPFSADSDGDGVDDPDELEADFSARDSDGDGKPDAVESNAADADEDCLPDELDDDDDAPNVDDPRFVALVADHCPEPVGVCGASGAALAVSCRSGLANPICSFADVADHEADETTCDALDNDCDGTTDEPAACDPDVDPILQGLVGHWPLDGDGADVGPHGDHGVVTGAVAAPDRFGVAGKAMRFAATGDRVSVASTHHPLGEVTVTYTAWVKPDPDAGAATGIVAFGDVLVPQRRSSMVTWGPRSCLEYTGEQNDLHAPTACTPDHRWSFVSIVKTGRQVKLYLNGREQRAGELQAGQDLTSTALQIGLSKWTEDGVYEQFRGVIDDVRVWSRALSDTELGTLYREGGWSDVGTGANPAASCLHVRDGGAPTGDGLYWLDPMGSGTAVQAYCDMTLDGGGWTLVWVYEFAGEGEFSDMTNAVTPVPSWRGTNIDVPVSTTAPTGPDTLGAIDWAAWPALGNELAVRADFVDTIACTPGQSQSGSLVDGLSGPIDCRVLEDRTATCDGTVPWWLNWHPTGPMLVAQSIFLYFDGATDLNWPTHDPCATNVPPPEGATTTGGALYLRPTDLEVVRPAVCALVPQPDRGTTSHLIDPDGAGGNMPFAATCDFTTERGGWTRLSPELVSAIQARGERPREYLVKRGGAWYRSPVTQHPWSWTTFAEALGLWVYDGPGGDGAFECVGHETGGWGIGCGTAGAERVLPGVGVSAVKNEASGTGSVCQAPPDAFQIGGQGCVDDAEYWVRPAGCLPDPGSLLGDGDLTGWAEHDPAEPATATSQCWRVSGPEGTIVADDADYPPGGNAPSLRATNPTVGNDIWALIVNQQNLTFVAGRAYRVGFWAKAAAPRPIRVFVQTRDLTHAFYHEDVALGTTWRWYELGFVADATSYDAMLDFQLAEFSTAAVWLDGIVFTDEGESPCVPSGDDLVADGGFAAGRTCWSFGHNAATTAASAWPDQDESLLVEQTPGTTQPWDVTLSQAGMTLAANRHYRLSVKARAAAARDLLVMVQDASAEPMWYTLERNIGTSWRTYSLDFVTSRASAAGDARIVLPVGGPGDVDLWIDDVALVDVGPSPCTTDSGSLVADGDFTGGLACWQLGWNRETLEAFAEPSADARAGQAPALEVVHAPGTEMVHEVSLKQGGKTIVAGRWYRLSYWARAAAPRTIRVAVWDEDEHFIYREPAVDTTWRHFVHDFRTTGASTTAAVEYHLAALTNATVWLDDVRLEDLGVDPCATPDSGSLVADGGFAAGALCWGFGFNADVKTAAADSDVDAGTGGTPPSLRVTQSAGAAEVWEVGLHQPGITIANQRWYRLTVRAKAAAERPMTASVADDTTFFIYRTKTVGTTWQTYTFDFATEVGSAAGAAHVSLQLADPDGTTLWLDDVRLEDLGPSPCVTSGGELIEDGELVGGLLCWLDASPDGHYEASADHPAATSGPSLAITNLVPDNELWEVQLIQRGFSLVAGASYRLSFWARAAAPRTIAALVHNWDTSVMHTYQIVDLGTGWSQHAYEFTAAATEDNVLVEFQIGQASTETVWLDGISLGRMGATIPTAGLVLHYPFDGDALDQSTMGNDGTVYGATLVADRHGNTSGAYAFDGVSNYIAAPIAGFPLAGGDRTVSFWMAPDTSGPGCGSTGSSVVYYGSGDCTGLLFGAGYCNESWYFWGGCYDVWPQSSSDPAWQVATPGQWSFVAMRLASGQLTMRIDDVETTVARDGLATQAGTLLIGAETINGGQSFRSAYDGLVDDVRVYDRALTDDELDALRAE